MREFNISKRSLILFFLLIALIPAGILAIQYSDRIIPHPTPTPPVDDTEASEAVIAGVETFFTVNYEEGKDAWLERFCSNSTQSGCLFATSGSTSLWRRYIEMKTVTTAEVSPKTLIRRSENEQIWLVTIQLSQPLPGSEKTQDEAYALAVRENGVWKFDRFLLPQEIDALQQSSEGVE
ncbi:hypothetical protein LARV_00944 [Longilinea arvoryzae]|uniref:Uncharacterized protein n=1 Tax=Longilinea arvoryzae TaxID=360412 RepID=A0A0S7BD34_9CHLR|nr:hypothetical protein [Longilinea arvoryzae]GAP13193.1 hypothetical protein LARV_00944 [Longilinea arvoryzae]